MDEFDQSGFEVDPGPQVDRAESETISWPVLILNTAARSVLVIILSLAAWGAVPVLLGWHPTTVMTGSMMPRLHVGDIAVSRPLHGKAPTLGTVLLFDDPDHQSRLRLHRFVAVAPDGRLITRGDANPENDSTPVDLTAVRGVGTLRIPFIGVPIVWLRTGEWVKVGMTAAGLVALVIMASWSSARRRERAEDDGLAAHVRSSVRRTAARRAGAQAVVGLGMTTAMAGMLILTVVRPAGAVFASTTSTQASMSALPYFTCSAAVAGASPYLYYRMDETTTTTSATDSSGSNRTGTYTSAGRTPKVAKACTRDTGYAMTFNGSTGALASPQYTTAPPNTFTVAIWFKTTTTSGGKLIGWGNNQLTLSSTYDRHLYMTNTGAVIFGVYPNAVRTITSADGLNDGKWHQAVGTLSSAGMVLYIDGVQVAADTSTTSGETSASGYWRIGWDNLDSWTNAPTSRYFSGTLDDAAVYLTALSATTVKNAYLAGT